MQDAADLGLGGKKGILQLRHLGLQDAADFRPLEIKLLPLGIGPKVHATTNNGFRV